MQANLSNSRTSDFPSQFPVPVLLLATFCLLGSPPTSATDYHLTPAGTDTNDGLTPQTAFRTLAAAAKATPAGKHVIHVAAGEYPETATTLLAPGVSLTGAGIGQTIVRWSARQQPRETKASPEADKTAILMLNSADASISGISLIDNLPDNQRPTPASSSMARAMLEFTIARERHGILWHLDAFRGGEEIPPDHEGVGGEHRHKTAQATGPPGRLSTGGEEVGGAFHHPPEHDPNGYGSKKIGDEDKPIGGMLGK